MSDGPAPPAKPALSEQDVSYLKLLKTLKTAVFAPIPSARVNRAMAVMLGVLLSFRTANRSCRFNSSIFPNPLCSPRPLRRRIH